jgi:hypothetical protein
MVEAVVAIPFFLLMFAAILYVNRLYETKMRVMRFAREAAWNYAMCNCNEQGDPITSTCRPAEGASTSKGSAGASSPSGYDPSKVTSVGGGPGGSLAGKDFGSSKSLLESTLRADVFLGNFEKKISSKTIVMCNEAPHDGNLKGWASTAMNMWKSW